MKEGANGGEDGSQRDWEGSCNGDISLMRRRGCWSKAEFRARKSNLETNAGGYGAEVGRLFGGKFDVSCFDEFVRHTAEKKCELSHK